MHYQWQILTKADSEESAKEQATTILENIGEGVYDYFSFEEISNATDKKFWEKLEGTITAQKNILMGYQEQLKQQMGANNITIEELVFKVEDVAGEYSYSIILYLLYKIAQMKSKYYCSDSLFATDPEIWGAPELPEEIKSKIKNNPKEYWLVQFDLHN